MFVYIFFNFFFISTYKIYTYILLHKKIFPFDVLEVLLVYDHNLIRFLKAKKAIINGDANDKN